MTVFLLIVKRRLRKQSRVTMHLRKKEMPSSTDEGIPKCNLVDRTVKLDQGSSAARVVRLAFA